MCIYRLFLVWMQSYENNWTFVVHKIYLPSKKKIRENIHILWKEYSSFHIMFSLVWHRLPFFKLKYKIHKILIFWRVSPPFLWKNPLNLFIYHITHILYMNVVFYWILFCVPKNVSICIFFLNYTPICSIERTHMSFFVVDIRITNVYCRQILYLSSKWYGVNKHYYYVRICLTRIIPCHAKNLFAK